MLMLGVVAWQLSTGEGDGNGYLAQQGPGEEGNTGVDDDSNGDEQQDGQDDIIIPGGDDGIDGGGQVNDEVHLTPDDRLVLIGQDVPGFGGMYFDPGGDVLNVFMLDIEDIEQRAAVERAIREHYPGTITPGGIRLVQGSHGIVQLKLWYDELRSLIAASELMGGGWQMSDLAEHENGITIGVVSEELFPIVERLIAEAGIPSSVVDVRVSGPIRWDRTTEDDEPTSNVVDDGPPPNATIRDRIRPVIGGVQTQGENKGYCTQAFNAIRSGVEGVVVNDHCTESFTSMSSTKFYQPREASNNKIGQETVGGAGTTYACPAPWWGATCRRADVAFVRFDSGIDEDMGHIARTTGNGSITINNSYPRYRVVSEGDGRVGQVVVMVGRTTGSYASVISRLCVDRDTEDEIIVQCSDMVSMTNPPDGDSGAPVFRITNSPKYGDVRLYGILWGGDWQDDEYAYSPMHQIQTSTELVLCHS